MTGSRKLSAHARGLCVSECRQTVVESPLQASPAPGVQVPSSTASEVVSQLATESSLEGDIFCGAVKVG